MKREVFLAVGIAALAGCQSMSTERSSAEISTAIQSWASAFNSCDLGKVSSLYAKEAMLWGTVAREIIATPEGIRKYFQTVCSAKLPPKVALVEQNIRVHGLSAVNAGTYAFTIFPDGQARTIQARFSFSYSKAEGQWLIVEHHSSLLPAPPK